MKSHRFTLLVVVVSLSTIIFAQNDTKKTDAPKSDAQKSFETMKTLAGTWNAKLTVDPPMPNMQDKDTPSQKQRRVPPGENAWSNKMSWLESRDAQRVTIIRSPCCTW